tara:strand:+ start:42 stop:569 length:528 start_codon:yes stop_codon:yes gene_type:complete
MKTIITTLLILLTLNSYSQEYTFTSEPMTSTKLDSLIWKKINEYRKTEDAITKGYGVPNTITKFGLGDMRKYCYEVTMRNSKLPHLDIKHSTYEEIIPTAKGECLFKSVIKGNVWDLTCDKVLEDLATEVVNAWINSWTHRTVIGWLDSSTSTVTSVFHISSSGAMHMDVTYHEK